MTISSRTPEGFPNRCPLCGANFQLECSEPAKDAPCPECGHLVWFATQAMERFQQRWHDGIGTTDLPLPADTLLQDIGPDSLDMVELVMELEEEFDLTIPDEDAKDIRTIGDVIRYVEHRRRGEPAE